ncbi:MAG: hypothetical protein GC180_00785 [Bacteroidetes bacterium]|nr:hypothetical protein [Bacteroidota bacterium]
MKLTYVSHASLFMESGDLMVLTDPWYFGPAYLDQWHVFPKPVDTSFVQDITHLILTHGHEDHLHIETLKQVNKDVVVYFPYTWKDGTKELIRSLGFREVHEVQSLQTVKLSDDMRMTFVVNGLDAFVVYECEGKVYVNLNDALNAAHWAFIEIFVGIIKKHWPKVDLLICGLGGASYFPNTVHAPGKDDEEIALLREQFLAHCFCDLVEEILPVDVLPFVPGFALLEEDKQWINRMKFSRNKLEQYYRDYFDADTMMRFMGLQPGDYLQDMEWVKTSPYHALDIDDNLSHLIHDYYADEILRCNTHAAQSPEVVTELRETLQNILPISTVGIAKELIEQINFVIQLKDVAEERYIHCMYQAGKLVTRVLAKMPANVNIRIRTYSDRLRYALETLWGGDVFYIGYGADIDVLDDACLEDNIDIVSLRLLSCFPKASATMLNQPVRAFKYLSHNPKFASLAFKQKIVMRGNMNKLPYNERKHWVNKGKCDVCRLCNIPLMSDDFGEALVEGKL